MKRLLLIDGSNMLFRAYYAIPAHLTASDGRPTNAVYGFMTMLGKLMTRRAPDYAAVTFDVSGPTFRHEASADYKANRERMPEDLRSQVEMVKRAVRAYSFPILEIEKFEADDVIATLTSRAADLGYEVVIVSADKDFSQLLTGSVSLYDGMGDLTHTPDLVLKKYGVTPEQFVDFQALCGDKIDNIPGVPGIGKKTAAKLLKEFGSLDDIFERLGEVGGKAESLLSEHRETALLSRRLAALDREVDLELDWEALRYTVPKQEALNEIYREFEFYSLLKATDSGAENPEERGSFTAERDAAWNERFQTEEFIVWEALWDGPSYRPSLAGLVLHGIASHDGEPWAVFLRGDEVSIDVLKDCFSSFPGELILSDLKPLLIWLRGLGFEPPEKLFDLRTAAYLLDPAKTIPCDLEKLSKIWLHRVLPSFDDLLGKGRSRRTIEELEDGSVSAWLLERATATASLGGQLKAELQDQKLDELARDEVDLTRILADMERAGILVDQSGLEELATEFKERLEALKDEIYELAGSEFNISSPKQLSKILFEDLGLPVIKKTKTGYSTSADVLERLALEHEIARHLLGFRKFEKLVTTYVDVLLREARSSDDGRIHATFGQTASTTGRLITSDPDLQRTPTRTAEGKRIRKLFVAPKGSVLLVADWSQIELRILAHLCGDPELLQAFKDGADVHRRTAGSLFGKPESEVDSRERDIAKTVNFATIYGQGASALAQNLGLARAQAQEIIEQYFELYGGVKSWIDETVTEARVTGKVQTLAGRTRFIPELFSKNKMVFQAGERMAVNTPVQGSAADLCKKVMLELGDELSVRPELQSRLLLQIHDELVFEVPEAEIEKMKALVRDRMENAWDLKVPLLVSLGIGPNWEDAK